MNSNMHKRTYTLTNRARQAAENDRNILEAAAALWREIPIHEISLERIAEKSGVTVRTILRKFGNKEELFRACIKNDAASIMKARDQTPAGDMSCILNDLLAEYEASGDAVIRTLSAEQEVSIAREILASGRAYHRAWCTRVFKGFLPNPKTKNYTTRLMSFVAATDVYLWKLLRKDLNHSEKQTRAVMQELLEGLISNNKPFKLI